MIENEYLCLVNYIGKDIDEKNIYEFIFSEDIDAFWIENGEYKPCCLCKDLTPEENSYNLTKLIKTNLTLDLIQDSCCYSFSDCTDGIVSLAYENIDTYEEYPENGRLVLMYGEPYSDVEEKLSNKNIILENA